MKKSSLILLSALSALALTSCHLFNDKDITIENHFKTKEEASAPKPSEATVAGVGSQDIKIDETEALVFKSIVYSNLPGDKIDNTYAGINGDADYEVSAENNNFDMYVPKGLNKADDQTIVLFIHGGAWVSGLKTHVNPYVKEFTKRGYISVTPEYTLLNKDFDNAHPELSVFRDLDEIDACISTIKSCVVELGFTGNLNLVIGGASSGSHLAMLYSYSRGAASAMPIKFIINAVGPTDIQSYAWKAFNFAEGEEAEYEAAKNSIEYDALNSLNPSKLRQLAVSGEGYNWDEFHTMKIANGMAGFQYTPDQIEALADANHENVNDTSSPVYKNLVSNADSWEKKLSVTYYVGSSTKIPMVCGYGGEDSVVGIYQFANLQHAMENKGYVKGTDYEFFYFKSAGHTNLDKPEEAEVYNAFIEKVCTWLAA